MTEENQIQKKQDINQLVLNNGQVINLEGLPEETVIELRKKQAEGMIGLQNSMIASGIDTKNVDQRLTDIANNVAKAAADQSAVTITGTYNDKLGRTEVIGGTSDAAHKGKLSRSQQGQSDNTLLYIGIAAAVIILLAVINK